MTSPVETHYRTLLASRYTWMYGGLEKCLSAARELLDSLGLLASSHGVVLDLGSGPGYHAKALAESGSRVIAVDNSPELLQELAQVCSGLDVVPLQAEISDTARYAVRSPFSAILCLGDTLTHLDSFATVERLIDEWSRMLASGGALALEFREQARDLYGQDAVLTTRADRDRIMQCVLHFEPERVWITDIVHEWNGSQWQVWKSTYPKLRLKAEWIVARAAAAGLVVKSDAVRAGRRVMALTRG